MRVAALLFTLLVPAAGQSVQPGVPPDFALKLSFGCPGNWIDTAAGTFVRQIDAATNATANLRLTADESRRIVIAINRIGFFDLRSPLSVHEWADPGNGTLPTAIMVVMPQSSTTIDVRMDGREKSVSLENAGAKADPVSDAGRLQQVIGEILSIYWQRPEVQRLPPPQLFCL